MTRGPKKSPREKDMTSRFNAGDLDDDRVDVAQRFTSKSKNYQKDKTAKTAQKRADATAELADADQLPIGEVVQVYSLFCDVMSDGLLWRCVVRKTLAKTKDTAIVVGDRVRFRDMKVVHESGLPEGVIETALTRETVLTRADSFKQNRSHPIVANAQQMLIVVSAAAPQPKWGLVDRMVIAAASGGLAPIICLNKIDLLELEEEASSPTPMEAIAHYASLGIRTVQTSVLRGEGIETLREMLIGKTTVLSGHSGVGKSSLVSAFEPGLDVRVGEVSTFNDKGMHTTTSARRYPLRAGGAVIDTPGVKVFGLWNLSAENLIEHFPDVKRGDAPEWRSESYERIKESL